MSWSIEVAGTKEDVKALIGVRVDIPAWVRDSIAAQVDSLDMKPGSVWPTNAGVVVYVKSTGHVDSVSGGSVNIEVRRLASIASAKAEPSATT